MSTLVDTEALKRQLVHDAYDAAEHAVDAFFAELDLVLERAASLGVNQESEMYLAEKATQHFARELKEVLQMRRGRS